MFEILSYFWSRLLGILSQRSFYKRNITYIRGYDGFVNVQLAIIAPNSPICFDTASCQWIETYQNDGHFYKTNYIFKSYL